MAKNITPEIALKKLDKQLECPLCLDPFKEPKLLPCFHVFCKSPCLEKLVARDGQSLQCPTCRHIVPLPAKGVSGLQSDFHIAHLFKFQEVVTKVDQSSGRKCEICEEHQATGYCHDCEQFACDNCQITHKRIKSLKNHKFITMDHLQADIMNLISPRKAIAQCTKHLNKQLEVYCETCRELICNNCVIHHHKDHDYDLIRDVFAKHKEEIVSHLKPVRDKLGTIRQTLKAFDFRANEINGQRVKVETDIHKVFDQLQRLLDQRRVQLVGTLDTLTQQKLKSLAAQRDHIEIIQMKFASCLEYAEGGLEICSEEEILAMKEPVLTRIEQINTEFDPDTIDPKTKSDLRLFTESKEQLQTACQQFVKIITDGDSLSPNKSFINHINKTSQERVVKVGEQKSVEFHARTKTNKQFSMNLDLKAELIHMKSKKRLICEVLKLDNGAYKISYQPARWGKHELHITLDGSHVQESPCLINVVPTSQSMDTPVSGVEDLISGPIGMADNSKGQVVVVEQGGHCISILTASSQSLNRPVRTMRGLNGPTGTAINSRGQIVVAEGDTHCISILTPEDESIITFSAGGSENGQLSYPYGVTIDKDDHIYVVDNGNHRVQKFTSEGKFVATVGSIGSDLLQFSCPIGICFHNKTNSLYVCDQSNHRIQVLSTDLTFKSSFGTHGSGDGQFQYPQYIAVDNTNNLYVTDRDNNRVQVFTAEGQFLRAFTSKDNGENLTSPFAIAIDSSNTVYVSEERLHCVSIFTSQGNYLTSFGKQGTEEGQFNFVFGLTVDEHDSIIVSDFSNGRLQIF